jgi:hypothetical protein
MSAKLDVLKEPVSVVIAVKESKTKADFLHP